MKPSGGAQFGLFGDLHVWWMTVDKNNKQKPMIDFVGINKKDQDVYAPVIFFLSPISPTKLSISEAKRLAKYLTQWVETATKLTRSKK